MSSVKLSSECCIVVALLTAGCCSPQGSFTGWLKKSKLLYCVNSLLFLSHPVYGRWTFLHGSQFTHSPTCLPRLQWHFVAIFTFFVCQI